MLRALFDIHSKPQSVAPQGRGEISGLADAIVFGVPYIANPDLVERLRADAPLNVADPQTFYRGGASGYTDYPALT